MDNMHITVWYNIVAAQMKNFLLFVLFFTVGNVVSAFGLQCLIWKITPPTRIHPEWIISAVNLELDAFVEPFLSWINSLHVSWVYHSYYRT